MGQIKSAYAYAKGYCKPNPENAAILQKYLGFLYDLDGFDIEDCKKCIMFAGALFDEKNEAVPDWKREERGKTKLEHQIGIVFDINHTALIDQNILILARILSQRDPENAEFYDKARDEARYSLCALYAIYNKGQVVRVNYYPQLSYIVRLVCNPNYIEGLKKHFKKYSDLELFTVDDMKNCIAFAGFLFDEMNDDLPSYLHLYFQQERLKFQKRFSLNLIHLQKIDEAIDRLYNIFSEDEISEQLKKTKNLAKGALDALYNKSTKITKLTHYKSALSYAMYWCSKYSDQVSVNNYAKRIQKFLPNVVIDDNLKNCILYSAALFDEANDDLPKWKHEFCEIRRENYELSVKVLNKNLEIIGEGLNIITEWILNFDPENKKQYEVTSEKAKKLMVTYLKSPK